MKGCEELRITIADGRSSFYQWDLNRKLCLEGVEPGTMVNFCRGDGTAYSVAAVQENGKVFAPVPNAWLQNSGSYPVYIYFENTHTTCKRIMHIQARPKPDDYVYTETEVLDYKTLEARMKAMEDNLDEQVASSTEEYLEHNSISAVRYVGQDLTPEEQSQARKNIGITGTGADGRDGFSPTIEVEENYTFNNGKTGVLVRVTQPYLEENDDGSQLIPTRIAEFPVYNGTNGKDAKIASIKVESLAAGATPSATVTNTALGSIITLKIPVGEANAVRYDEQNLTEEQKAQARKNIGVDGGSGGLAVTDDGNGNVTITSSGSVSITDDGNGNVTIA